MNQPAQPTSEPSPDTRYFHASVDVSRQQRAALVTGASCGLGRAIATELASRGYKVFAASRKVNAWTREGPPPPGIIPWVMDVTQQASVDDGIAEIVSQTSRLDLVVNNAGFGVAGAVEETPMDAARAQLETNFFGTARVCRAVLPTLRKQRHGCIINVTSVGGRIGLPYQSYYTASKFAVEGFTEALRYEMAPFGVHVCALAPGNFQTHFDKSRQVFGMDRDSPYAERAKRALDGMAADEAQGASPQAAARVVWHLAQQHHPPLRKSVGPWFERVGLHLSQLMPRTLFDWGYKKVMRV